MVLWGLQKATAGISFDAMVATLRATSPSALLASVAATFLSFVALLGYDLSGLRYVGARPPLTAALLASFCGFAIGNTVGLGAFSGGAVRYRLYSAAGLSPGQIARVIFFIAIAFGIGLATITALGLVVRAEEVGGLLGAPSEPLRSAAAVILVSALAFLFFCAARRTPLQLGPVEFAPPGVHLVLIQIGLTALDILAAATALWVLLPTAGTSFIAFAAVYAAALTLGVLSHVPGGLGVFEVAILFAIGNKAAPSTVAAALVVYRAVYFLLPLLLATVLLASFEARRALDSEIGQRVSRAAAQLAPSFIAVTTFGVGATLVVSGAMPAFIDRLQILQVSVPLWVVETSHLLSSIAGLVLLFAARGLFHRLDGAWWLAFSIASISIPFALTKGLAIIAPSVLAILLVGLVMARRQFRRHSSLFSYPLTMGWGLAVGCVLAAMISILFFAFYDVEYGHELWWQFEFDATAPRALRAVAGVAVLGLVFGLSQLLRPAAGRIAPPSSTDLERARRIAAEQPRADALLALMGDKSFLFSDSGEAFLMFAKRWRTWASLGDPVGLPKEWPELVWRFVELADAHGERAAFYQVPASTLPLYLDAGLKLLKVGEAAHVPLADFNLNGSSRAGLRYALKRGERDGLEFEMIPPGSVDTVIDELRDISNAWLARQQVGEKAFSVAAFTRDFVVAQPVALLRQRRQPIAFATVMTTDIKREVTAGLMRYRPGEASRYAMEYLFVRLIEWARDQGYGSFNLGIAPLSGLGEHRLAPRWHRLGRVIRVYGHPFYNFQGLRSFKDKFDPIWEPRYLAASGFFAPYLALLDITALTAGGLFRAVRQGTPPIERRRRLSKAVALCAAAAIAILPFQPAIAFDSGNLGNVHVVNPREAMRGLVVLFSDQRGWTQTSTEVAAAVAEAGALVVGVDLPAYLRRLDQHQGEQCHMGISDIEWASRQIQRGNAAYHTPILAGFGEGGVLAEALLAQARPATVKGAAIVDPTVALHTGAPLCSNPPAKPSPEGGFSYGPWQSLSGFLAVSFSANAGSRERSYIEDLKVAGTKLDIDEATGETGLSDAMAALLRPHLGDVSNEAKGVIASLPLVELPAVPHGRILAIIFSGDGGWRDIDKTISQKLCSDGVSVIGWDSLHYFWSRKSPERIANDLSLVIDTYASRWGASKVALIGYSFGAGILPFAYDRLTHEAKQRVVQISLLGLAPTTDFEISIAGWLGEPASKDAAPTIPALASIDPRMIQCFYGEDDTDSVCPQLGGNEAEIIRVGSGHHFGGDYDALAQDILVGLRRRAS
jgi:phosphatidylglycerol lysyltransferase